MENYHGLELNAIKKIVSSYASFDLSKNYIMSEEVTYSTLLIDKNNQRSKEALQSVVKHGPMPFYGIKDISYLLNLTLKDGVLKANDLFQVLRHLECVNGVISFESKIENEHEEIANLVSTLEGADQLQSIIAKSISSYGEVLDDASSDLKYCRKQLNQTDAKLRSVANEFVSKYASKLQEKTISIRDNRLCVLVKSSDKNSFGGYIHGDSASGMASYVEPNAFVALNNKVNSLRYKERDEIDKVLRNLSILVKEKADLLMANLETLTILDVIYAKAMFGYQRNGVVAELNNNNLLKLKSCRHPLIADEDVVSNNYNMESNISTIMITGPNTGGKTVSLKVIGLAVLMTYLGIPVLADEASICYFDRVYEDITDDQSIIESLSTFSSHLKKQAEILSNATSKSLVILDEIGSGTDPLEGAALAIAILDELRRRKCKTIITTHLGKLKNYAKSYNDILIASVQFDSEKLMPTYRYIEGLSGQSNALDIALRFGLNARVVEAAMKLREEDVTTSDELIEKLEIQILENQQLKDNLVFEKKEIEKLKVEIEKEKNRIQNEHEIYVKKLNRKSEIEIDKLKNEAIDLLDEVKNLHKNANLADIAKIKSKINVLDMKNEEEYDNHDMVLKVGDLAEMRNSLQVVKIVSINKKKAIVSLNGINVSTKLNNLKPTTRKISKEVKKARRDMTIQSFNTELNVIGCRSDEALNQVSEFIDRAILNRAKLIRIVHCVGSGILRKMIHRYLKQNKYVESFRIADANAGGSGATEVILK